MTKLLTVLEWRKGAGIDVDVRIDLDRGHIYAAAVEQCAEGAGDDALADATDHATRNQNVFHFYAAVRRRWLLIIGCRHDWKDAGGLHTAMLLLVLLLTLTDGGQQSTATAARCGG